jgi:hypothetical protein
MTPQRVLAECEAKRAIVDVMAAHRDRYEAFGDPYVLKILASVYRTHPDFDPAWSVT